MMCRDASAALDSFKSPTSSSKVVESDATFLKMEKNQRTSFW